MTNNNNTTKLTTLLNSIDNYTKKSDTPSKEVANLLLWGLMYQNELHCSNFIVSSNLNNLRFTINNLSDYSKTTSASKLSKYKKDLKDCLLIHDYFDMLILTQRICHILSHAQWYYISNESHLPKPVDNNIVALLKKSIKISVKKVISSMN